MDLPAATLGWCKKLAQLIATFSSQKVNYSELTGNGGDVISLENQVPDGPRERGNSNFTCLGGCGGTRQR